MSYHIYTTKGIVLSQRPVGEADRIYSILTRELGLVKAKAISVRKSASKLRGSIEPYSISDVSFVRGKGEWRLTSAELIQKVRNERELAKPLTLLEKLVQGEEPHPELFDAIERELMKEEKNNEFEINLVAKIMYHLGYVKESDLSLNKKALINAINEGLKHSHLS